LRDYKAEYRKYHGKPEQVARRSQRNKARRKARKAYGDLAIRGKDIDHRDRNPNNNSLSNLRIQSKSKNRSRNG
jgi:hypothetical protein